MRLIYSICAILAMIVVQYSDVCADNSIVVKEECVNATIAAITMEIKEYENRLKEAKKGLGPKQNVSKFKQRIEELKGELNKFKMINIEQYMIDTNELSEVMLTAYGPVVPPIKKKVHITVCQPYSQGSILDVEKMTRSGPFYHIAGIKNNNYNVFKTSRKYELVIYLVYKKEYFGFIPNYYVYIAEYMEL
ncbi:MAG: hypothetical protein ACUVRK_06020 [Spirochaetota bacterium]